MSPTFKRILLTGSAIVAANAMAGRAQAQTVVSTTTTESAAVTGANGAGAADNSPGANGTEAIQYGANNFTITNSTTLTGGTGQNGAADADNSGGNAGGNGAAGVDFESESGASGLPALVNNGTIVGGNGGAGSAGGAGGAIGGNGGIGAAGVIDSASNSTISGTGTVTGGNGGAGGASTAVNGVGGTGGAGAAAVSLSGSTVNFTAGGNITGGTGGAAGTSTGNAANVNGGVGGAGIVSSGTGNTIAISSGATVTGGAGGAAGSGGSGAAGTAGAQGNGITASGAGTIINVNSGATVTGVTANGITVGAAGDDITNAGTISTTSGNAINVQGAGTTINNTNGTITATTGEALNIGAAGTGAVVNNGGSITSANTNAAQGTVAVGVDQGAGGISFGAGGTITNSSTGNALYLGTGQTGTVTNAGTIQATNGTGVFLANGNITNSSTGTISGATAVNMNSGNTTGLTNAGTITGNIVTNGSGTENFTNSGTVTGNVTLNPVGYGNVTMNGGTVTGTVNLNGTLALNGGQIVGNTTLTQNAGNPNVLTVGGAYTTGGTITGAKANTTVSSGGNFTIDNAVSIGTGTFTDSGATVIGNGGSLTNTGAAAVSGSLDVDSNGTTIGALTNTGTVHVAAGNTLTTTSYGSSSTGVYDVGVSTSGNTNTGGILHSTGGAVNLSGGTVHVTAVQPGNISLTGSTIIATGSVAESGADLPTAVTDNSYLYNFTVAAGAGGQADDLLLTATHASNVGSTPNNNAVLNALFGGSNLTTSDADLLAVQSQIGNDANGSQFNRDVQSLQPNVDGGLAQGAIDATDKSFDLADQQLAMLREDDATTGMAAGDGAEGLRTWVEGFGGHSSESDRDGAPGYSSNTAGGAIGVDTQSLYDNTILGVSASFGHTHVDNNVSNHEEVNAYQATLYGNHYLTSIDQGLFIDGMAAFQYGANSEHRYDLGGVTGLNANGDYDSWEGAGRLELGRDFGLTGLGGVTLTPLLLTDYTYYHADSYSESGAGGAGLSVGANSDNIWNLGVGGQATWLFKDENGSYFKPDVHASYKYDVLSDDKLDVTSTFEAGGPSFSTDGLNPSNQTVDAGFDIRFYTTANWEFTGSYDFTWKPDYNDNTGLLRAAYKF